MEFDRVGRSGVRENRRKVGLVGVGGGALPGGADPWGARGLGGDPGGSLGRLNEEMERQLRLQNAIVAAERERQVVVEKVREHEDAARESAEKNLARNGSGTPAGGVGLAGLEEREQAMKQTGEAFEKMGRNSSEFIDRTGSGLTNLLRNTFKSELHSANSLWDGFCRSLLNSFAKTTAKMASSWLEDIVGVIFGSSGSRPGKAPSGPGLLAEVFHGGGVAGEADAHRVMRPGAFADAPRLHSGLAPDEFPAILQKGERVLPRGESRPPAPAAQRPAPRVAITVNDYSGQRVAADEREVSWDPYEGVLSVVIEASGRDPRFHDAIKRANRM